MKFKLILIGIAACLLAACIPIPGTDIWYSQFAAVMLFGFLTVSLNIFSLSIPIGILFLYLIFSAFFINHLDIKSIMCLVQTSFCLSMANTISNSTSEQRRKIWVVIGALLTFQVFWGFVQMFNIDPIFHLAGNVHKSDTVGFSGSHNQYGLFLSAAAPVAFLMPFTIPFVITALVLSKTFSALIAFIFSGLFFFRKKINFLVFLAFVAVVFCVFQIFNKKDLISKFSERSSLWTLSITQVFKGHAVMEVSPNVKKVVDANPFLGFGFSKFMSISPFTQKDIILYAASHRYEHAHNDYVEALFDLGVIGFLIVVYVFVDLVRLYLRKIEKSVNLELATAGLIAFSVCALSIYTVHTAYNGMFLCVLLGIFYAEVKPHVT